MSKINIEMNDVWRWFRQCRDRYIFKITGLTVEQFHYLYEMTEEQLEVFENMIEDFIERLKNWNK